MLKLQKGVMLVVMRSVMNENQKSQSQVHVTALKSKLGNSSDEAMKRCDEALNASSLQFFASVKCFIASLL